MRENVVDGPAGRFVEFFLGHTPIAVAGPLGPGEIPVEPTSMLQQFPERESLMEQVQLRLSVWRYIEREKQRNPPPPAQRQTPPARSGDLVSRYFDQAYGREAT